jgi:aminopeptidase N
VEKSFPQAPAPDVVAPHPTFRRPIIGPIVMPPPKPSPARNVQVVADRAADAITSFTNWFGPYPYPGLALTQMPGDLSQGWPGLIFLSSYAFLSPQEQTDLHLDHLTALLSTQVLVHETAHQWWGDLVLWKSYRDQWIVEALANYASLLTVEQRNPVEFRQILELYRSDLLSKNKEGEPLSDAGPVTLGSRLISSHFPGGYEAISYERGTWLFHMLRCMLRDAESGSHSRNDQINPNEPFFRALRKVRDRYAGKPVSTQELIAVFAEELPRPLWYEKRRSLDWFLDGWINGTALPHLETHDVKFTPKENGVLVSGTIVQKDAPDDLVTAVPVYGAASGNSLKLLGVVLADGNESTFRVTAPAGTRRVVLDPEQTILTSPK